MNRLATPTEIGRIAYEMWKNTRTPLWFWAW